MLRLIEGKCVVEVSNEVLTRDYDQLRDWCKSQNLRWQLDWGFWLSPALYYEGVWFAEPEMATWFLLSHSQD